MCISILHDPGDDQWGYEKASERWLPVHTVTSIILSVISMLADPNDESPANVDAAVCSHIIHRPTVWRANRALQKEWRTDYTGAFKKRVQRCVRKSQESM